jgi:transposase
MNREWDGLAAHRNYPMVSVDNYLAERAIRGPVVTRKKARGSHNGDTARNAAVIWTVIATAPMADLNKLAYLTACLDECECNRPAAAAPPFGMPAHRTCEFLRI